MQPFLKRMLCLEKAFSKGRWLCLCAGSVILIPKDTLETPQMHVCGQEEPEDLGKTHTDVGRNLRTERHLAPQGISTMTLLWGRRCNRGTTVLPSDQFSD